jgi:hypothetical protein
MKYNKTYTLSMLSIVDGRLWLKAKKICYFELPSFTNLLCQWLKIQQSAIADIGQQYTRYMYSRFPNHETNHRGAKTGKGFPEIAN